MEQYLLYEINNYSAKPQGSPPCMELKILLLYWQGFPLVFDEFCPLALVFWADIYIPIPIDLHSGPLGCILIEHTN